MSNERIRAFVTKYWLPIAIGSLLITVVVLAGLFPSRLRQGNDASQSFGGESGGAPGSPTTTPASRLRSATLPTPTFTPQRAQALEAAVAEAKKSAASYDTVQEQRRVDYPWLRKFPVANLTYFVFFDLNKHSFVGKLHPKPGDDVARMKAEILRILKDEKGIPVDSFPMEWLVFPQ